MDVNGSRGDARFHGTALLSALRGAFGAMAVFGKIAYGAVSPWTRCCVRFAAAQSAAALAGARGGLQG